MQEKLTTNGIIFISAGFTQPYSLQVIALSKIPRTKKLNMCLSDGDAYMGAIYQYEEMPDISKYTIVKVVAKFYSMQRPILIQHLQILDNKVGHMIRRSMSPQTLNEYLKRQGTKISQLQEQIKSMKKVKTNQNQAESQQEKSQAFQEDIQKKIIPGNDDAIVISSATEHPSDHNLSSQCQSEISLKKKNSFQKQGSQVKEKQQEGPQIIPSHNSIKDLYEKMIDWKILAKVNFLQHFKCQTGKSALSFILQDQFGDEIKCTYFPKANITQYDQYPIIEGKIYTFFGGDIKIKRKVQKSQDDEEFKVKQLQITFVQNITPILRESLSFTFCTKKLVKLSQLKQKPNHSQVKIIGLLKRLNRRETNGTLKKIKYQCLLCDPNTKHQIEFGLAINQKERKLEEGNILVLHNFNLIKKDTEMRLYCSNRSYFTQQNNNSHSIFESFNQFLKTNEWKTDQYISLSSPPFKLRTIQRIKQLTQNASEGIYSIIGCRIKEIKKERIYHACNNCHSFVSQKQTFLFYCSRCKKMVDNTRYYMFTVWFKDKSDVFKTLITAKNSQDLIGTSTSQLQSMSLQDEQQYIQLLKLNNYVLFLRTEMKNDEVGFLVLRVIEGSLQEVLQRKQFQQMDLIEQKIEKQSQYEDQNSEILEQLDENQKFDQDQVKRQEQIY